jgi:hypothetical protein
MMSLSKQKSTGKPQWTEVKTLDHFYSQKLKTDLLPTSECDRRSGEALLVKWVVAFPFGLLKEPEHGNIFATCPHIDESNLGRKVPSCCMW